MIEKYEIIKNGQSEKLVLYLNFNYEYASFDKENNNLSLIDSINNYIVSHHINFKGKVISLVVGGIFVGNIILKNNVNTTKYSINNELKYTSNEIYHKVNNNSIVEEIQKKIEENRKKENEVQEKQKVEKKVTTQTTKKTSKASSTPKTTSNTSKKTTTTDNSKKEVVDNNVYITISRNGKNEKIELEEYIIGVVGAEMPASFHLEALKAQAIISRTYALKAKSKGTILKTNEANQSYKTNAELKALWGSNYNTYYNKIKSAVVSTKGQYLTYNGNYIEAVFHSTSNGKTESSSNVWGNSYPYLVNVESKYDSSNPSFSKTQSFTYSELSKKLGFEINNETEFVIESLTSGNRVNKIKVGDKEYRGVDFRNKLGLRSADFTIEKQEEKVVFTTKGYGHGVGLSQYGANGYAKNGYSYEKILKHYYPGVSIKKM